MPESEPVAGLDTVEELSCVLCVPCFEVLKMASRSRQRFCQVGRSCSGAWKALEAMPSSAKVAGRVQAPQIVPE